MLTWTLNIFGLREPWQLLFTGHVCASQQKNLNWSFFIAICDKMLSLLAESEYEPC